MWYDGSEQSGWSQFNEGTCEAPPTDGSAFHSCGVGDNEDLWSQYQRVFCHNDPGDCCLQASLAGDPHGRGAHGDKFSLRGKHAGIYNMLSAPNVSFSAQVRLKAGPVHSQEACPKMHSPLTR